MLFLPTSMGGLHRALLRARMPVLWGSVAMAALAVAWRIEDPMLQRRIL